MSAQLVKSSPLPLLICQISLLPCQYFSAIGICASPLQPILAFWVHWQLAISGVYVDRWCFTEYYSLNTRGMNACSDIATSAVSRYTWFSFFVRVTFYLASYKSWLLLHRSHVLRDRPGCVTLDHGLLVSGGLKIPDINSDLLSVEHTIYTRPTTRSLHSFLIQPWKQTINSYQFVLS